ncbi:uncharacterized protein MONOS_1658 [Monocercomonoides exilis]|uniref:uncharacterized protein n=1 Tax=Monocercomonoides exilis TaxID=2049356 RepID=UPI00355A7D88|nr:hypothetical protein MONOS_1658 [Monocercomonoides exilis]|eukprot:MONOS_1658.1-p1 / transcript=MONOS_1658.1 / gene=MONOS_1658 / organism=Monocercomonoides_exilis_PA203 / gene_product=unspecified product / transcript_product=unspecified product / location=Mono_scaffold00030:155855-167098(+) / protein_length=3748 / sequence_SO=supercontig / SO=protein_coding / is_pseudo=false
MSSLRKPKKGRQYSRKKKKGRRRYRDEDSEEDLDELLKDAENLQNWPTRKRLFEESETSADDSNEDDDEYSNEQEKRRSSSSRMRTKRKSKCQRDESSDERESNGSQSSDMSWITKDYDDDSKKTYSTSEKSDFKKNELERNQKLLQQYNLDPSKKVKLHSLRLQDENEEGIDSTPLLRKRTTFLSCANDFSEIHRKEELEDDIEPTSPLGSPPFQSKSPVALVFTPEKDSSRNSSSAPVDPPSEAHSPTLASLPHRHSNVPFGLSSSASQHSMHSSSQISSARCPSFPTSSSHSHLSSSSQSSFIQHQLILHSTQSSQSSLEKPPFIIPSSTQSSIHIITSPSPSSSFPSSSTSSISSSNSSITSASPATSPLSSPPSLGHLPTFRFSASSHSQQSSQRNTSKRVKKLDMAKAAPSFLLRPQKRYTSLFLNNEGDDDDGDGDADEQNLRSGTPSVSPQNSPSITVPFLPSSTLSLSSSFSSSSQKSTTSASLRFRSTRSSSPSNQLFHNPSSQIELHSHSSKLLTPQTASQLSLSPFTRMLPSLPSHTSCSSAPQTISSLNGMQLVPSVQSGEFRSSSQIAQNKESKTSPTLIKELQSASSHSPNNAQTLSGTIRRSPSSDNKSSNVPFGSSIVLPPPVPLSSTIVVSPPQRSIPADKTDTVVYNTSPDKTSTNISLTTSTTRRSPFVPESDSDLLSFSPSQFSPSSLSLNHSLSSQSHSHSSSISTPSPGRRISSSTSPDSFLPTTIHHTRSSLKEKNSQSSSNLPSQSPLSKDSQKSPLSLLSPRLSSSLSRKSPLTHERSISSTSPPSTLLVAESSAKTVNRSSSLPLDVTTSSHGSRKLLKNNPEATSNNIFSHSVSDSSTNNMKANKSLSSNESVLRQKINLLFSSVSFPSTFRLPISSIYVVRPQQHEEFKGKELSEELPMKQGISGDMKQEKETVKEQLFVKDNEANLIIKHKTFDESNNSDDSLKEIKKNQEASSSADDATTMEMKRDDSSLKKEKTHSQKKKTEFIDEEDIETDVSTQPETDSSDEMREKAFGNTLIDSEDDLDEIVKEKQTPEEKELAENITGKMDIEEQDDKSDTSKSVLLSANVSPLLTSIITPSTSHSIEDAKSSSEKTTVNPLSSTITSPSLIILPQQNHKEHDVLTPSTPPHLITTPVHNTLTRSKTTPVTSTPFSPFSLFFNSPKTHIKEQTSANGASSPVLNPALSNSSKSRGDKEEGREECEHDEPFDPIRSPKQQRTKTIATIADAEKMAHSNYSNFNSYSSNSLQIPPFYLPSNQTVKKQLSTDDSGQNGNRQKVFDNTQMVEDESETSTTEVTEGNDAFDEADDIDVHIPDDHTNNLQENKDSGQGSQYSKSVESQSKKDTNENRAIQWKFIKKTFEIVSEQNLVENDRFQHENELRTEFDFNSTEHQTQSHFQAHYPNSNMTLLDGNFSQICRSNSEFLPSTPILIDFALSASNSQILSNAQILHQRDTKRNLSLAFLLTDYSNESFFPKQHVQLEAASNFASNVSKLCNLPLMVISSIDNSLLTIFSYQPPSLSDSLQSNGKLNSIVTINGKSIVQSHPKVKYPSDEDSSFSSLSPSSSLNSQSLSTNNSSMNSFSSLSVSSSSLSFSIFQPKVEEGENQKSQVSHQRRRTFKKQSSYYFKYAEFISESFLIVVCAKCFEVKSHKKKRRKHQKQPEKSSFQIKKEKPVSEMQQSPAQGEETLIAADECELDTISEESQAEHSNGTNFNSEICKEKGTCERQEEMNQSMQEHEDNNASFYFSNLKSTFGTRENRNDITNCPQEENNLMGVNEECTQPTLVEEQLEESSFMETFHRNEVNNDLQIKVQGEEKEADKIDATLVTDDGEMTQLSFEQPIDLIDEAEKYQSAEHLDESKQKNQSMKGVDNQISELPFELPRNFKHSLFPSSETTNNLQQSNQSYISNDSANDSSFQRKNGLLSFISNDSNSQSMNGTQASDHNPSNNEFYLKKASLSQLPQEMGVSPTALILPPVPISTQPLSLSADSSGTVASFPTANYSQSESQSISLSQYVSFAQPRPLQIVDETVRIDEDDDENDSLDDIVNKKYEEVIENEGKTLNVDNQQNMHFDACQNETQLNNDTQCDDALFQPPSKKPNSTLLSTLNKVSGEYPRSRDTLLVTQSNPEKQNTNSKLSNPAAWEQKSTPIPLTSAPTFESSQLSNAFSEESQSLVSYLPRHVFHDVVPSATSDKLLNSQAFQNRDSISVGKSAPFSISSFNPYPFPSTSAALASVFVHSINNNSPTQSISSISPPSFVPPFSPQPFFGKASAATMFSSKASPFNTVPSSSSSSPNIGSTFTQIHKRHQIHPLLLLSFEKGDSQSNNLSQSSTPSASSLHSQNQSQPLYFTPPSSQLTQEFTASQLSPLTPHTRRAMIEKMNQKLHRFSSPISQTQELSQSQLSPGTWRGNGEGKTPKREKKKREEKVMRIPPELLEKLREKMEPCSATQETFVCDDADSFLNSSNALQKNEKASSKLIKRRKNARKKARRDRIESKKSQLFGSAEDETSSTEVTDVTEVTDTTEAEDKDEGGTESTVATDDGAVTDTTEETEVEESQNIMINSNENPSKDDKELTTKFAPPLPSTDVIGSPEIDKTDSLFANESTFRSSFMPSLHRQRQPKAIVSQPAIPISATDTPLQTQHSIPFTYPMKRPSFFSMLYKAHQQEENEEEEEEETTDIENEVENDIGIEEGSAAERVPAQVDRNGDKNLFYHGDWTRSEHGKGDDFQVKYAVPVADSYNASTQNTLIIPETDARSIKETAIGDTLMCMDIESNTNNVSYEEEKTQETLIDIDAFNETNIVKNFCETQPTLIEEGDQGSEDVNLLLIENDDHEMIEDNVNETLPTQIEEDNSFLDDKNDSKKQELDYFRAIHSGELEIVSRDREETQPTLIEETLDQENWNNMDIMPEEVEEKKAMENISMKNVGNCCDECTETMKTEEDLDNSSNEAYTTCIVPCENNEASGENQDIIHDECYISTATNRHSPNETNHALQESQNASKAICTSVISEDIGNSQKINYKSRCKPSRLLVSLMSLTNELFSAENQSKTLISSHLFHLLLPPRIKSHLQKGASYSSTSSQRKNQILDVSSEASNKQLFEDNRTIDNFSKVVISGYVLNSEKKDAFISSNSCKSDGSIFVAIALSKYKPVIFRIANSSIEEASSCSPAYIFTFLSSASTVSSNSLISSKAIPRTRFSMYYQNRMKIFRKTRNDYVSPISASLKETDKERIKHKESTDCDRCQKANDPQNESSSEIYERISSFCFVPIFIPYCSDEPDIKICKSFSKDSNEHTKISSDNEEEKIDEQNSNIAKEHFNYTPQPSFLKTPDLNLKSLTPGNTAITPSHIPQTPSSSSTTQASISATEHTLMKGRTLGIKRRIQLKKNLRPKSQVKRFIRTNSSMQRETLLLTKKHSESKNCCLLLLGCKLNGEVSIWDVSSLQHSAKYIPPLVQHSRPNCSKISTPIKNQSSRSIESVISTQLVKQSPSLYSLFSISLAPLFRNLSFEFSSKSDHQTPTSVHFAMPVEVQCERHFDDKSYYFCKAFDPLIHSKEIANLQKKTASYLDDCVKAKNDNSSTNDSRFSHLHSLWIWSKNTKWEKITQATSRPDVLNISNDLMKSSVGFFVICRSLRVNENESSSETSESTHEHSSTKLQLCIFSAIVTPQSSTFHFIPIRYTETTVSNLSFELPLKIFIFDGFIFIPFLHSHLVRWDWIFSNNVEIISI